MHNRKERLWKLRTCSLRLYSNLKYNFQILLNRNTRLGCKVDNNIECATLHNEQHNNKVLDFATNGNTLFQV
jgi:hypothetical protein